MASPRPQRNPAEGINIEAWTEDAVESIPITSSVPLSTASMSAAVAASPPTTRPGGTVTLDIPLDAAAEKSKTQQMREAKELKARIAARRDTQHSDDEGPAPTGFVRPKPGGEPRRRDSLKRREALLKGKEGSRRRQKWENDRLLGNPAFQPPEPQDWAPHPTHSTQNVPYVLAPLWDQHYAATSLARTEKAKQAAQANDPRRQVPRELREKLKRARGAKTLLQDLEEQVRGFVRDWEDKQRMRDEGWDVDVDNAAASEAETEGSEEEEVVFVGRKDGAASTSTSSSDDNSGMPRRKTSGELQADKLVFDSLVDDHGASFGRWLVHSIASYYNLRTWSRTIGDPARREAYVGIPSEGMVRMRSGGTNMGKDVNVDGTDMQVGLGLPRPLYVLV